MQLLLAGSSGFLGTHLTDALRADGHDITRLVRRTPAAADEVQWSPADRDVPQDVVDAADVVINLCGSPTAGNPHSRRWASDLRTSRVDATRTLAAAVARSHEQGSGRPALFNGSAVGYYGDHGTRLVAEASDSVGGSFMTSVVREWEAATTVARHAGARVCLLRTAPVMDRDSAPLKQLLPVFRLGLGARLGGGSQYFPMVSLRDWVGGVQHLLGTGLAGPVNLCCPMTPTNTEFTQALADAVGRRARLAVPSKLIEAGAGRISPELLGSCRVTPLALRSTGYVFRDHDVRDVISAAVR
ncbi:TIGR01777 family oxidoreductase [Nocardioides jiangxiensis]|uniref:TIGR01777 family oxidoreductase n=1 Tax=Nocardioides jiangxiensis TaxID=3064524 RepID=A0ABT9AY76_9ACTN|nr:TIGR01777 family oxidoreductase [Nocardioides sp. WY-20]MDO7867015.1 TIGR01777 family oxidoreductase [Nocardioides sp. WY-20]